MYFYLYWIKKIILFDFLESSLPTNGKIWNFNKTVKKNSNGLKDFIKNKKIKELKYLYKPKKS